MKVREIMKTGLQTVTKDYTLQEAAAFMERVNTGVLPVVDGDRHHPGTRPIGIVTDRDIVVRCIADGRNPTMSRVSEAYTTDVITCDEDDSERQAFETMRRENVGRLLVRGQGGKMSGIVSMADIIDHAPQNVWDSLRVDERGVQRVRVV